jgi:prepilin-type N-terminal cleavage/methylation domain-containing protein
MRQLELELKRFKKGFSLIEVLVAVMILAVVGVALMQINIKNQKISEFIDKKTKLSQISSIIGFHHKTDYKKLQKSIYDFLKNDYEIDNTYIKQKLDSYKIYYDEKISGKIEFDNNNSQDIKSLNIIQAIAKNNNKTTNIYFLESF